MMLPLFLKMGARKRTFKLSCALSRCSIRTAEYLEPYLAFKLQAGKVERNILPTNVIFNKFVGSSFKPILKIIEASPDRH